MTREEAIRRLGGILTEAVEFENSVCYVTEEDREPLEMAIKALDQEPCEDEYIKVPKKALKYRTAGMVAYNVAWLREHWQMEMDIVCGVKLCEDVISRQAVKEQMIKYGFHAPDMTVTEFVEDILSVNPQLKTGRWIPVTERLPEDNKTVIASVEYDVYPEAKYTKEYGWEWAYEAGTDYWVKLEKVKAWMPLPEPYDPQESEDKE